MESLRLENGDLVFENHDLVIIDESEELAQCCRIAIGTNKGEWFLNPDMGIDYDLFTGKSPAEEEMREELREALLKETRILTVEEISFSSNRTDRTLSVTFSATGTDGVILNGEEVDINGTK